MKLDRLNRGEAIAMVSALVLFVVMFLDWFGYSNGQSGNLLGELNLFSESSNAWQAMEVIPIVLELTIVVTVGAGLLTLFDSEWKPSIPPSAATAVLGGLSFLLIFFRIIDPPSLGDVGGLPIHTEPRLGIYLGLAAAAGIAGGGYTAMRQRGSSFAQIADALAVKPTRSPTGKPKKRSEKRPDPSS